MKGAVKTPDFQVHTGVGVEVHVVGLWLGFVG